MKASWPAFTVVPLVLTVADSMTVDSPQVVHTLETTVVDFAGLIWSEAAGLFVRLVLPGKFDDGLHVTWIV